MDLQNKYIFERMLKFFPVARKSFSLTLIRDKMQIVRMRLYWFLSFDVSVLMKDKYVTNILLCIDCGWNLNIRGRRNLGSYLFTIDLFTSCYNKCSTFSESFKLSSFGPTYTSESGVRSGNPLHILSWKFHR